MGRIDRRVSGDQEGMAQAFASQAPITCPPRRPLLTAARSSSPFAFAHGEVNDVQCIASIHAAIATIIRFSVGETKPSGTFDEPPTQAHFSSRLSI